MEFYKSNTKEALNELNANENGLTEQDVKKRLLEFGENKIVEKKKKTSLQLFFDQFKSVLIWILLAATAISFLLGEFIDAIVILAIVLLNALLGFYQERKAENILEALKKLTTPNAKVLRNGKVELIKSELIVPGDIIILTVGDRVPADCRILEESNLKTDESTLTGESTPVEKAADAIEEDTIIGDRRNMLFSSTNVVYGHCRALVIATGMNTEFGRIAASLQIKEEQTPLQKKIDKLSVQLGVLFLAMCSIIFLLGFIVLKMDIMEIFLISVALAVAAIPEGLLASITMALSLGIYRMAQRKAVIRKMTAVETLGSTTVICTDKTGTLTVNEMTVRKLYTNGTVIDVTGEGYNTAGNFYINKKEASLDKDAKLLLKVGAVCNDATLHIGDPTEIALLVSAKKTGIFFEKITRIDEVPFTSERKMMSVLMDNIYTKGAVEEVLKKCAKIMEHGKERKITTKDIDEIHAVTNSFASQGLRVLGFAYKNSKKLDENNLTFVGLQAMIDPPRKEAFEAIKKCKKAGIKVVMITGDHKETALAIARELGLTDHDDIAVTGLELDNMSDRKLEESVEHISVYARVSPQHKVRITEALRKKGHIVAMTGDGINDAIALKTSDIGIAMGITGTDVSKEASDMVLTDDNFSTIVNAVEEGRGIYDNIKKVIAFLLSGNIAEVLIIFLAIVIGMPLPLIAIQILWINLVTDGLPALALSIDPIDPNIMKRKPRPKDESIWKDMRVYLVDYSLIVTIGTLLLFAWGLQDSLIKAQTIAFTAIVIFEKYQSFSCRSITKPILNELLHNKWLVYITILTLALHMIILYTPLNAVFKVVPLSAFEWVVILMVGSISFIYLEVYKWLKQRRSNNLPDTV